MSAAVETGSRYPNLPGFAKENRELVYAMTEAGWTGRMTNKGHWMAKAPDRSTQITVPAKNGNNRGLANAKASFLRWVKAHMTPEEIALWDTAKEEPNPLLQDVMAEGLVRKQAERTMQEQADRDITEAIREMGRLLGPVAIEPWLARKQPGPNGGQRYESQAVLERKWTDGLVDYVCAFPGCDWDSDKPVSVARHYGAAHTRNGAVAAVEGPAHADPEYTEPTQTRDYRPAQRLLDALIEALDDALANGEDRADVALRILTWFHDRPDIDHEPRPLIPMTDRQMLDKIRMIVGQPDQSMEIDALKADITILESEVHRLREERTALRELLS